MAGNKSIDPRRLSRLAAAARKAGITRLRVDPNGGVEFDVSPIPVEPEKAPSRSSLAPPPIPEAKIPKAGSMEWVLQRFGKSSKEEN